MKIPTNKVSSIINFYKEELKGLYSEEEIRIFINLCLEHYLGYSSSDILLKKDSTVSESELLKFNFAVKDLKSFKPIQYILGETEFYGLTLKVNSNVLIPRPETEELVDLIIKENLVSGAKSQKNIRILDIGTGSGCIAISLKKNLPEAEVFALDVSKNALEVARENAKINEASINYLQADILNNPTTSSLNNLDIIVSNPPYICIDEKSEMSDNVLKYEPHEALFVNNNDPVIFYKAIAEFATRSLSKGGKLYFEINEKYGSSVAEMLSKFNFTNIMILKDMRGKDRIIKCTIT